jgi:hypothetical protein
MRQITFKTAIYLDQIQLILIAAKEHIYFEMAKFL